MASLQGWGRQTWNSGAWNTFAPVEATGNGLTSSVGSVSLVTTNIFGVTGINIASSVGDATQASEYAATGNALTSARGQLPNPTIVDNQLLTGWNRGVGTTLPLGWSTSSWGNGDFVLTVSGNALTTSIGDEVPTGNADVTVTGLGATSAVGQAQSFGLAIAEPTGVALTSSLGTETVTGSSAHTVTGIGLTSSIGNEIAQGVPQSGWNRGANQVTEEIIGWSDNLWGTLETSYSLSGNSLSIETNLTGFTGSVAPTITGTSLTASASAPGTSIDLTGLAATSAIGTFSISGDNNLTIVVTEEGMTSSTGTLPQTNLNKVSIHLLIPFKGTLHKLFFKQTGDNFSTTIKVWINDFANEVFQKTHINNPGDGTNFGNMNEIDINLDVNIGDTVLVALDAQQAPGIKLITGHLLYSQIINT